MSSNFIKINCRCTSTADIIRLVLPNPLLHMKISFTFNVYGFFIIILIRAISCLNFNPAYDIETGSLRRFRPLVSHDSDSATNTTESDEDSALSIVSIESDSDLTSYPYPIITLDQYSSSLKINILIYLLYALPANWSYTLKASLILYLLINILIYLRPNFVLPSRDTPTVTINRWIFSPFSWFIEIFLLASLDNQDFLKEYEAVELLSVSSILKIVFILQMAFYLSAFIQ